MGSARVTMKSLEGSVHSALLCRDCHATLSADAVAHGFPVPYVDCSGCHGTQPRMGARPVDAVKHGGKGAPTGESPTCADCHGTHDIRRALAPGSSVNRASIVVTCAACHGPKGAAAKAIGSRQVVEYRNSVHGRPDSARAGLYAAVCTDCHGTHVILPASDPASKVHESNLPRVCGSCHQKELQDYSGGIHGSAHAQGILDAPSCTDCHGEHRILAASESGSSVSQLRVSETCARCHEDKTLIQRYGLSGGRISTYRGSYHGVANKFGDVRVASCASCHSYHMVLPTSDPRSSVNPRNLAETCGKPDCHPGAGPNIARGTIHLMPSPTRDAVLFWVGTIYAVFIWVLILSFVAMIAADLFQHWRRGWKAHEPEPSRPLDTVKVRRFTRNQLLQHGVLIVSFVLLLLTGFPVRYASSPAAGWLVQAFGGVTMRGAIHRVVAVVLIGVCVWHLIWTIFTRRGRADFMNMLPEIRDIGRAIGMLKYYLGLAMEMPGFGRFNLIEKFEYLAMGWGSVVMIVTGFALWFPEAALRMMPKWGLDVCHIVHGYEAVLAFLAITIWHFYHVHFKPGLFPMSRVFLDGEVTLAEMRHEHRLEYERLTSELASRGPSTDLEGTPAEQVREVSEELELSGATGDEEIPEPPDADTGTDESDETR